MQDSPIEAEAFQRLKIAPAYRLVADALERGILDGRLAPGTALPTEQALAERFGVNRSTVREAIRRIEQDGLLQRRAGRRLYVALPGLHEPLTRALRERLLAGIGFRELWQVALELEPLAARLAAQCATEADLAELDASLAASEACTDPDDTEHDTIFHALVARAAHNRALMLSREPFSLLYGAALARLQRVLPQAASRNCSAHRHIVAALRRRDGDEATRWTRKHMLDFERGYALAGLDMDAPAAAA